MWVDMAGKEPLFFLGPYSLKVTGKFCGFTRNRWRLASVREKVGRKDDIFGLVGLKEKAARNVIIGFSWVSKV